MAHEFSERVRLPSRFYATESRIKLNYRRRRLTADSKARSKGAANAELQNSSPL